MYAVFSDDLNKLQFYHLQLFGEKTHEVMIKMTSFLTVDVELTFPLT